MNAAQLPLWRRLCYTPLTDLVRGRWNASLDWRFVVAGANLPRSIANLIGCVVRRTRLMRSEKVDVARELIAHFQDGLEAGRTSQELTESFGDLLQAARLIRRAKRRCRSVAWHVWCYGLWTFWAALGLYAISAICLLMPSPWPNTDCLSELNAEARNVAPDQRAWPVYRGALVALGFRYRDGDVQGPDSVDYRTRPGDEHWSDMVRFLDDHADALAQLRAAAMRPHLGYELGFETRPADFELLGEVHAPQPRAGEVHPSLIDVRVRYLTPLRGGVRLLEADTYRAAEAGDAAMAHADVVAILGVSRQLVESPFLFCGVVALAVEDCACDIIEHVLTVDPTLWTDRQLVDLAHRLGGRQFDPAAWIESERIGMHDVVQRLYTDDGHGDGIIAYDGLKQLADWANSGNAPGSLTEDQIARQNRLLAIGMPLLASAMASRAELEDEFDKLFDMAVVDLETPLWKPHHTMDDEVRQLYESTWSRYEYAPIIILMPGIDPFRFQIERTRGRAEGVMIGLALAIYHRENGHWPESLNELAPRWLPTVSVDRINGGPLGYRIVDDRPIVYSLGADGTDDGGRRPFARPEYADAYPVQPPSARADAGDWVIWSTVPREAAPKWEAEETEAAGDGE